jgi:ELWxxDGT repeat protein
MGNEVGALFLVLLLLIAGGGYVLLKDDLTGSSEPDGEAGTDGQDGADGHGALVVTYQEPSGSNCADGGIRIEVGVDDDDDAVLDAGEVDQTQYICDGTDGSSGQDGKDGANGTDGTNGSGSADSLLSRTSSPSLQECSAGGRIMEQGLDDGDGGSTAQNGVLEEGEVDFTTKYCSRFVVTRMTDINPGPSHGYSGGIGDMKALGTRLYFVANDGISGSELWAHETNNGSTWQVADINPDFGGSSPRDFTVLGTRLYFGAYDGSSGYELWAHETANSSTWQAADSYPGYRSGFLDGITAMGTRLYFSGEDGNTSYELWVHETANGSTWLVADINGGGRSRPGSSGGFTVVGTRLYFDADDGISGRELWMMEIEHTITYN